MRIKAKGAFRCLVGLALFIAAGPCHHAVAEAPAQHEIMSCSQAPSLTAKATPWRSGSQRLETKSDQKPAAEQQPGGKEAGTNDQGNKHALSPQKKKEQAKSLIEGVLDNAKQISPVEYRVLTEVEAATLLWRINKDQSISVLKGAVSTMKKMIEDEQHSSVSNQAIDRSNRRLRFLVLRKIAALNPGLIKDLFASDTEKSGAASNDKWTDDARAVMSIALEEIESDPKTAGRLAEQSISLGLVDWPDFLNRLSERDAGEAERIAKLAIDQLKESPLLLRPWRI
jgi:hypothetical protein